MNTHTKRKPAAHNIAFVVAESQAMKAMLSLTSGGRPKLL
jgi:hypothetical protein